MKRKFVKYISLVVLLSITSFSITKSDAIVVYASDVTNQGSFSDSNTIKSAQGILNLFGYNCGNPDGVMGEQTKTAISQFQEDVGLDVTGELNYDVVDYLLAGVPMNVFTKRYNEAIDYSNKKYETNLQHGSFDDNTEEYCANNNLVLSLNPNLSNRKMIGNINIYSGKNGYDPIEASGEMGAAVYAFDISIDTPYDAYTLLINVQTASGGTYSADGITFDNYSGSGMIAIKAEYDNFSSSSISTSFKEDNSSNQSTGDIDDSASTGNQHYDTSNIDNESVTEFFEIENNESLQKLMQTVGKSETEFAEVSKFQLDDAHLSESNDRNDWYKVKGKIGNYDGNFEISLDKGTKIISRISFGFLDEDKPIDVEPVVTMLTDLIGKEYSQNTRPDQIAGNYTWNIDKYKIDVSYWGLDDPKYPGANYIGIVCAE